MTNEELQKKLELLKIKLNEATIQNNTQLINQYVADLNKLWKEASVEMLKNAENGGWYTPDKS
tara:strand:+ start:337 stop:525 length:189 start_codon:yes stop_codon:yes gene_type:complete